MISYLPKYNITFGQQLYAMSQMVFESYDPSANETPPQQYALFHRLRQLGSDASASLADYQRLDTCEYVHRLVTEAVYVADG